MLLFLIRHRQTSFPLFPVSIGTFTSVVFAGNNAGKKVVSVGGLASIIPFDPGPYTAVALPLTVVSVITVRFRLDPNPSFAGSPRAGGLGVVSAGLLLSEDTATIATEPPRVGRVVDFGTSSMVEGAQFVFVLPQ